MHFFARLTLILVAAPTWTAFVRASNVVNLDQISFDQWVGNGKSALVEFWAPWCDHCQQLEPVYEKLGDVFAHVKDNVVIAKVNIDDESAKPLIEKFSVTGLPTIKWFGANGESEEYDPGASRKLKDLADYITDKSGLKANFPQPPPPPPPATKQLTPDNFDDIVNDPTKDVLVAFTATWCPHCQTMKPVYDLVARRFKSEKHVVIANLDGDVDVNLVLAKKYGVEGYPILKLFPKGLRDKTPINYEDPKDEKHLVEFLNKYTGTQRAVGGGLTEMAGRSEALDDIAKEFVAANLTQREAIYQRVQPIAMAVGNSGKQYLRIMDKLIKGTDDFLTEEKTRLLRLLNKDTLAEDKADEIKVKYNILSTFVISAAAQAAEGIRIERVPEASTRKPSEPAPGATDFVETEMPRAKDEL